MEPFVPIETSREETTTWSGGQQLPLFGQFRLLNPSFDLVFVFIVTVVLLIILVSKCPVNNGSTLVVANTADEIGRESFGERSMIRCVVRRRKGERLVKSSVVCL